MHGKAPPVEYHPSSRWICWTAPSAKHLYVLLGWHSYLATARNFAFFLCVFVSVCSVVYVRVCMHVHPCINSFSIHCVCMSPYSYTHSRSSPIVDYFFSPLVAVSLTDVQDIEDPLNKVEAGLVGGDIPLQSVHIKAKLIDLAAQVITTSPCIH